MPVDRATLELFVPLDRGAPLRAQIEDAICAAITGGGAPPGTRLPASRVLADTLGVSRGVVSEAYAQIAAEGWIEIRRGAAPVVRAVVEVGAGERGAAAGRGRRARGGLERTARRRARAGGPATGGAAGAGGRTGTGGAAGAGGRTGTGGAAGAGGAPPALAPRLDLTATAPDLSAFPRRAWAAAMRRVIAEVPDAALDYGDPRGDAELRRELAAYLVRVRGAAPGELVITSGYTQGLWLTCRALAAARGDDGRRRGPVTRRLVGDDPLRGPGGGGRARRRARADRAIGSRPTRCWSRPRTSSRPVRCWRPSAGANCWRGAGS